MRLCILINTHIIWKDILRRAFGDVLSPTITTPKDFQPSQQYDHIIVVGEPNSIGENIILNYVTKNNVYLYYMGYSSSICNTTKYLKYNGIFLFQEPYERSVNLKLQELQRYLGTSKVHIISNPIYLYDHKPITQRVTYRYGLLTDKLDENQLLSLTSITELHIGVLIPDEYDRIEEYCENRGMNNVKVYICDTLDSFHYAFNTCERIICEPEYIPLCESCKLMVMDSDITTYEITRLKNISVNRSMDYRTLLLTLSNNIDMYTNLTLSQTLEGQYRTFHTKESQGKKIKTTYPPFAHLSTEGGISVISNLVDLFITNQDISLTYSNIPIDYPWIGVLNSYSKDLFSNVWLLGSLKTCMGFIAYSKQVHDEVTSILKLSNLGIYSSIPVEIMFPSIPTYKHVHSRKNKLVSVGGNITSIFSYNRLPGYDKYYYGFTLPPLIPTKDDPVSDSILLEYPGVVYNTLEPEKSHVRDDKFWKLYKDLSTCKHTTTFHDADVLFTIIHEDEHYSFILVYSIIHCIPIIVNRTKLTVEYLGDNYPLFSDTSAQETSVGYAREHLRSLELPYPLRLENTTLYSRLY